MNNIIVDKIAKADNFLIRHIRKWWRPVTCIFIAGTMFVHGILIPVYNMLNGSDTATDLTGLSLLVTAIAGAFAVREWGKAKGLTDDVQ